MSIFNFFKHTKDNKNIIYILDRLLQISIGGEIINEKRNIDLSLYNLLNSWPVNQEIVHMGVIPVCRENKNTSKEFISFVENLWAYMEYDINADYFWAKTFGNTAAQEKIYLSMCQKRRDIIFYLYNKKAISNEVYQSEQNHLTKHLKNYTSLS